MNREKFIGFLVIIASIISLYLVYDENRLTTSDSSLVTSNTDKDIVDIIEERGLSDIDYILLDSSHIIINNDYSRIYDVLNDAYINFIDIFKDKDIFYDLVKKNLTLKYPKFVVDGIDINNYTATMTDEYIDLYFDSTNVVPNISDDVNIRLICRDYKDNSIIDCDDNIEENPNTFKLDNNKKSVAITFDDGPCKYTYRVIEELNNNHMSATFFELGSMMKNYPDITREVLKNNFEVGSHGYSHKSFKKIKLAGTLEELAKTNEVYKEITGQNITITRPPYGAIDNSIKEGVDTIFVKWNVDSLDWKEKTKFIDNIMNVVDDGDIILLHDIHETTVNGLSTLLPLLYSKGFQVVSVSELASIKGFNMENKNVYFKFKKE